MPACCLALTSPTPICCLALTSQHPLCHALSISAPAAILSDIGLAAPTVLHLQRPSSVSRSHPNTLPLALSVSAPAVTMFSDPSAVSRAHIPTPTLARLHPQWHPPSYPLSHLRPRPLCPAHLAILSPTVPPQALPAVSLCRISLLPPTHNKDRLRPVAIGSFPVVAVSWISPTATETDWHQPTQLQPVLGSVELWLFTGCGDRTSNH